MKINLPVSKDNDKKEAITYQSWHWDLMVYHCTGWDSTLLPMLSTPYRAIPGSWLEVQGQISP